MAFGVAGTVNWTQVISEANEAINVFDFHEVAKRTFLPGHYAMMALGTDDGGTLRANREGFKKIQLRMRRLVAEASAWASPIT